MLSFGLCDRPAGRRERRLVNADANLIGSKIGGVPYFRQDLTDLVATVGLQAAAPAESAPAKQQSEQPAKKVKVKNEQRHARDADVGARHVRLAHVARYSGSSAAWQAQQGQAVLRCVKQGRASCLHIGAPGPM